MMPVSLPATPSELAECSSSRASNLSPLLYALWHEARGDWERAHSIAQTLETAEAAWVHAYLHRKEGDTFNAGYWYRRAGRAEFTGSLHAEWTALAAHLLAAERLPSRQAAAELRVSAAPE